MAACVDTNAVEFQQLVSCYGDGSLIDMSSSVGCSRWSSETESV